MTVRFSLRPADGPAGESPGGFPTEPARRGRSVRFLGYEFPGGADDRHADWFAASARCRTSHASVSVAGAYLRASELEAFGAALGAMSRLETSEASLTTVEPFLSLHLRRIGSLGAVGTEVELCQPSEPGDHHVMHFRCDLPDVDAMIGQMGAVLRAPPVRGVR